MKEEEVELGGSQSSTATEVVDDGKYDHKMIPIASSGSEPLLSQNLDPMYSPKLNGRKRVNKKQGQERDKRPKLVSDRPQRSTVLRQESDRAAQKRSEELRKMEEKLRKEEEKARKAAEKEERRVERAAKKVIKDAEKAKKEVKRALKQDVKKKEEEKRLKKERAIAQQAQILSKFVVKLEKNPKEVQIFEAKTEPDEEDSDVDVEATSDSNDDDGGLISNDENDGDVDTEPELEIVMANVVPVVKKNAAKFSPMPFEIRANTTLAPIHRRKTLNLRERKELEALMKVKKGGKASKHSEISVKNLIKEFESINENKSLAGRKKINFKKDNDGQRLKVFKFRYRSLQKMTSFPGVWPRQEDKVKRLRRRPWYQMGESESGEDIWDESADEGSDEEERNFKGEVIISESKNDADLDDLPRTRSGVARSANSQETDAMSEYSDADEEEEVKSDEEPGSDHSDYEGLPDDEVNSCHSSSDQEDSEISIADDVLLDHVAITDSSTVSSQVDSLVLNEDSMGENLFVGDGDDTIPFPEGTFAWKMEHARRDWNNLDATVKAQLPPRLVEFVDSFFA